MIIKIVVEYLGTNYNGFQSQPEGKTIQDELQSALKVVAGEEITIHASGRTDAGVHAAGQVCSFEMKDCEFDGFAFCRAMNAKLPKDIAVTSAEVAPEDFHARFDAKSKIYVYKCYLCKHRRPILDETYLHVYENLNIEKMREASRHFIGTHDFTTFCSAKTDKEDKKRTIQNLVMVDDNNELYFIVKGDGFLKNMVRIIVGTLLEVGQGKIPPFAIPVIMESLDRENAGKTAPAHGLTLEKVEY